MRNRIWHFGLVWCLLAIVTGSCLAQFGLGPAAAGISERGRPTTIDLKDATLGQVVDALIQTGGTKSEENQSPINILISDKLRDLKVGTVKLNDLYPKAALEAISKLTDESFIIEEVASGQVLVLKEFRKPIVVRAIKLERLSRPNAGVAMSMMGESEEEAREQAERLEVFFERQILEMQKSIEIAFEMYEETSGSRLDRPKLQIQGELMMVIAVGTEESVAIAAEIIEASLGAGSSGHRMGGGMGMGGMGMGGGAMGSGMLPGNGGR